MKKVIFSLLIAGLLSQGGSLLGMKRKQPPRRAAQRSREITQETLKRQKLESSGAETSFASTGINSNPGLLSFVFWS